MRTALTLTLREWQAVADRLSAPMAPVTAEPGLPARIAATVACLRTHGYAVASLGLDPRDARVLQAMRSERVENPALPERSANPVSGTTGSKRAVPC
jgi:hypothetical protein